MSARGLRLIAVDGNRVPAAPRHGDRQRARGEPSRRAMPELQRPAHLDAEFHRAIAEIRARRDSLYHEQLLSSYTGPQAPAMVVTAAVAAGAVHDVAEPESPQAAAAQVGPGRAGRPLIALRCSAALLLVAVAALSLLPHEFRPEVHSDNRLEHLIAYAAVGSVWGVAFGACMRHLPFLALFAALMEVLQVLVPGRTPRLIDFAASFLGVLCGLLATRGLTGFTALLRARRAREPATATAPGRDAQA